VLRRSGPITHFHLGGDEAFTFGQHPDTEAFIANHGKAALYLHHVQPLCDMLASRGIRPILWHDMMVEWDEASLARLGRMADVMVWSYRGHVPDEVIARFRVAGLRPWGACAFKGADSRGDGELPDVAARVANAAGWAEAARRHDLVGVVATGWSRYSTHRWQCEPIDGALDALVKVGGTLRGAAPMDDRQAEDMLRATGNWDRFTACRGALTRLSEAKRETWQFIILSHEQAALERLDPARRGSGILTELHRIAALHLAAAETASHDVRRALVGLVDNHWIEQFVQERLEPLREHLGR
jgi:hypothetical protein